MLDIPHFVFSVGEYLLREEESNPLRDEMAAEFDDKVLCDCEECRKTIRRQ